MSAALFELRIVIACCVGGHRVEAGALVRVSVRDADGLLATGRAELLREPDRAALIEEIKREQRRALGAGPAWGAARHHHE